MRKKKAILFGASQLGLEVLGHVRDRYTVIGFADNDSKKQGGAVAGIPVYAPDIIMELNPDIVFVSSVYSPEIMHQLAQMGFPLAKIRNAGNEQMHIPEGEPSPVLTDGVMKTATSPIRTILSHPACYEKSACRHAEAIAQALAGDYEDAIASLIVLLDADPKDPLLPGTAARIYGIIDAAATEHGRDVLDEAGWRTLAARWSQETDAPPLGEMVLVSVIVPVYKTEAYLARCLDSLIAQTMRNIEIIVVNDDSPDNAHRIISDYQARHPDIIVSTHKPNGGLSSARNHGMQIARGRYIGYVDSDDFVETTMFETLFDAAHLNQLQISIGQYYHYPPGGRITVGSALLFEDDRVYHGRDFLLQSNVMVVWNKLYEHAFIKRFLFPETWFEDVAWSPVVMSYAERVGYVPVAFYHYIRREDSIASSHHDPRTLQGIESLKYALANCNTAERDAVAYMAVRRLLFEAQVRICYADKYLAALKAMGSVAVDNRYVREDRVLFSKVKRLINGNPVIPKVVYHAQFGQTREQPEQAACRTSWTERLMYEDGRLHLLDENTCDLESVPLARAAYERGAYGLVGDYFRLKAICDNGGIALSPNVQANHFIAPKLTASAFFAYTDRNEIFDGVFAAIPGHELTVYALNKLETYMEADPVPQAPLARALTESLHELYGFSADGSFFEYGGHTFVYPAEVFYVNLGNVLEDANDPRCNITEYVTDRTGRDIPDAEACTTVHLKGLKHYVMRREEAVREEMSKRIDALLSDSEALHEIRRRPLWRVMNAVGGILDEIRQWRQTRALVRYDTDWGKRGQYARDLMSLDVDSNLVLLESFYGRGLMSSPYALFCAWQNRPDFDKRRFVWVLDDFSKHKELTEQYAIRFKNVAFVQRGSSGYMRYLATAKYLVNDVSFFFDFVKRDEQVYVNTWHSITVKTLGFDIPGKPLDQKNVLRNFLACDYILSPNEFMRKKIFLQAHRLDGLFPGRILEEGHPRDDLTFSSTKEEVLAEWKRAGVAVRDKRKIIMYAPTWRGSNIHAPSDNVEEYLELVKRIQEVAGDEYDVVIRVHQSVDARLKKNDALTRIIVPAAIDANRCFSAVDILITDYSSIYFDYLVTGNPVLFYIRDMDAYQEYRGVYFSPQELPGPSTGDPEELVRYIRDISAVRQAYQDRYERIRAWACPYEDGRVSERVLAAILDEAPGARVHDGFDRVKKKVLFYAGTLLDTPATRTLFSILQRMHRQDFDISVLVDDRGAVLTRQNAERLLSLDIRPIGRSEHTVFSAWERYCVDATKRISGGRFYQRCAIRSAMRNEWRRCLGKSAFDYIVNLDAESLFHAHLLLNGVAGKKIAWCQFDETSSVTTPTQKFIASTFSEYDLVVSDENDLIKSLGARLAPCTAPGD